MVDDDFLQAIRGDPLDEAPWLIYSDWLDEHGDPRSALYRQRHWTNSLGIPFVLIPRGRFWMGGGGGKPGDREVTLPQEFYLGAYPVTQDQWQSVMGANPSWFSRTGREQHKVKDISDKDLEQFPVENVSYEDVQQFLANLNARDRQSGWIYRLPREAEWEYACRAAAFSQEGCSFHFYLDQPGNQLSSTQANCVDTMPSRHVGEFPLYRGTEQAYLHRTTRVGSYQPNRLGLYDMHGNVWEWCEDFFEENRGRVIRGGCWINSNSMCRAARRFGYESSFRVQYVGFRLARVPSA